MNKEEFIKGYLKCALWSSSDANDDAFDTNYDILDIAEESMLEVVKDCMDFLAENRVLLEKSELSPDYAGHDFWLTRNGHGAGFWDRGLGEIGDKLTEACKPYGESYIYVGDDQKLYIS